MFCFFNCLHLWDNSRRVFYKPVCFDRNTPVTFGLPHSLPASLPSSSCLPVTFQSHWCRFVWREEEILVLLNQTSKQQLFLCLSYFATVNITRVLLTLRYFGPVLKNNNTQKSLSPLRKVVELVVSRGPQFPQTPNWAQGRPGALWSNSFTNKDNMLHYQ